MKIVNVRHKGLKRFITRNDASGLPARHVGKIRNMIAFLQDMEAVEELQAIPVWKAHRLTGNRKGQWSLFVSRNWRIVFAIHPNGIEIVDLDFTDYH